MKYRPEIDGLRALAVLPVILFHAEFSLFQGGYVGVDVFFVISGYLVTKIIHDEMRAGRFSFVTFYERRVRRILPALYLVILATIPFAWAWMLPLDMKVFAKSIVAVSLFSSNILFPMEGDYFSLAAALKPLIHTWSLAVEEQFYMLFPLALLAVRRRGRWGQLAFVGVLSLASLAAAQWGVEGLPRYNFFLLTSRFWELGIGAMLAIGCARLPFERRWAGGLAFAGGAMIVGPVFLFGPVTPFPSVWTLIPVLGAAAVIVGAHPRTLVGRVLAWPPLVGVGLVSYSAYLWHQPLFALARLVATQSAPGTGEFLILIAATFVLSLLSWRYVERPFRDRKRFSRRQMFTGALIVSFGLIGFGLAGYGTEGFPQRFHDVALARSGDELLRGNAGLASVCDGGELDAPSCRTSDQPEVIVWGDSHAMHLVPGLLAADPRLGVIQATMSTCGPFMGLAPVVTEQTSSQAWAKECQSFNRNVMRLIERTPSLRVAVLGSSFSWYLGNGEKAPPPLYVGGELHQADAGLVKDRLRATLDWLRANGIVPVVFGPPPANGVDLGRCALAGILSSQSEGMCVLTRADAAGFHAATFALLSDLKREGYPILFIEDALCGPETCTLAADGAPIYRDESHLSVKGSAYLGRERGVFDEVLRLLKEPRPGAIPAAPALPSGAPER